MKPMKEIYLDNAATTPVAEEVIEVMERAFREDYGNPSSLHRKGMEAERSIKETAEIIAKTLRCDKKELLFTSGGTESNNLAILGAAEANARHGKKVLTTAVEHPSVANAVKELAERGFMVRVLPVDAKGRVSLEALEAEADEEAVLCSMMMVNNEIGTIQPLEEAAEILHRKAPHALLHVDAVQGYGKVAFDLRKIQADLLSVSGHKLFGPKGSGFLYVKEKTKLKPLLFGGGQQKNLRSGTENVPAILGLGKAAELAFEDFAGKRERLYALRDRLISAVTAIDGVSVNGGTDREIAAPHIISVSTEDVRAEVLLHALEEEGIYVSAGSACSSHKKNISATLQAIGLKKSLLDCTVRFSLSARTTEEEIDTAAEAMKKLVPALRRYTRR